MTWKTIAVLLLGGKITGAAIAAAFFITVGWMLLFWVSIAGLVILTALGAAVAAADDSGADPLIS